MSKQLCFFLVILIGLTANAQTTIDLHGTVSNQAGKPIASAIVTLVGQGLKDTTGGDGVYSITKGNVSIMPLLLPQGKTMFLNGDFLEFNVLNPASVKVEIFDLKGNLLKKELLQNAAAGFYCFNIANNLHSAKLLIVRAAIGRDEVTLRWVPLHNGKYMLNSSVERSMPMLAKISAVNDSLKVAASGFQTKTVAITSYNNQQQNISLDSAAGNVKNPPCPSGGCGKDLGDLKTGYYTITSASLNRSYYLSIPTGYDKNAPIRMIFAMHCMGSNDTQCATSYKFWEMQTYAANAKIPVILVAPQGYTDNSPWRVNDNKDHVFFGDMLTLLKGKLCVDTSRVFCCGFSYGAMVSYSLSLDFTDQLRAVATYAPANWNIWLPANTHKSIAYYQTTGTDDNLCKWINSDASKQGGKYCVLQHIEDNGCTAPATIPTATGKTHVSTEFAGCKAGYPVIFGSFQGSHSNSNSDAGSSTNWIAKETWDFFMRF